MSTNIVIYRNSLQSINLHHSWFDGFVKKKRYVKKYLPHIGVSAEVKGRE